MVVETEPTSLPSANQQGDLNIASGGDTTVGGDVVGRDQITNITNIITPTPGAPVKYATRADYLAQIIDRHQDLEFVGIPELKDRQALRIEDVFIHLQAEIETVHTIVHGDLIVDNPLRVGAAEQLAIEGNLIIDDELEVDGEVVITGKPSKEKQEGTARFTHEKIKRRVSANEALSEHQRLVILGDPGAGKTTLLKYITVAFAQKESGKLGLSEDRLPIFVRLYDYVAKKAERQEDYSLVRYLYTQAEENLSLKLEPGFFESELERGNCCVCLDGLDELGGAGLRREVTNAVASLANRYPRNRYIVTPRIVGYEEAPLDQRDFTRHTVLPLTDDDIREFVKKWYAAREKDPASARERVEHLTKTIMGEPRIKSLAANPLMLTIIALVHRIEAELPHERVKLYDKCVTALVETWEKVKGLTVEDRERPHYKYRRRLLEQLAFWMHSQPGTTGHAREVKEGDLELQLTRLLLENPKLQLDDESARQEAQAFIALAKSRTGLLIERGEGVYTFTHLTFQEYLAAGDIEHRLAHSIDAIWGEIKPRLHDPHWREVILLLLGSLNKFERHPTELVRRILKHKDKYGTVLHRHLFLAARVLADRVEVEAALHDKVVNRLLGILRSDKLAHDDALTALGTLQGDNRVAKGLLDLARDKDVNPEARCSIAQTLGQLAHTAEAATVLLDLAQNEPLKIRVRHEIAEALRQLGQNDYAVALLRELARSEQEDIFERFEAAVALGEMGLAEEAMKYLRHIAHHTKAHAFHSGNTQEVFKQLGQASDTALSNLRVLAHDKRSAPWMRVAAAMALGQLGLADDAVTPLMDLARGTLAPMWMTNVEEDIVQSLMKLIHADKAIAFLHDLVYDKSTDKRIRRYAALQLGQLGYSDQAIPILLDLARDKDVEDEVRRAAAQALGQLGQIDDAIAILRELAHNKHVSVAERYEAAVAIGELGQAEEAMQCLHHLARDDQRESFYTSGAQSTFKQLGQASDKALSNLHMLAHDRQSVAWMQVAAAQALGQLGRADEAAAILLDLARNKDVDNWARREAAQALGQLGHADETVLSSLLALARDKDEEYWVRRAAYQSLKGLLGGGKG